jgi:hypothetical protein
MGFYVRSAYSRHATGATSGSMQIKPTIKRGLLIITFPRRCDYSHGLERGGSGIRSLIRASKLPRSAEPAEPQSRTPAKNPMIQGLIQRMAAVESRARTRSTTRSSRKSKIRRLTRRSSD